MSADKLAAALEQCVKDLERYGIARHPRDWSTDAARAALAEWRSGSQGRVADSGPYSTWTVPELQAEIGRLQQALTLKVCGDPIRGIGLTVRYPATPGADHG